MGSLQTFDLKCELFEYSQERFTIPEVDGVLTQAQADLITAVFSNHKTVQADGTPVDDATFDANTGGQNTAFEDMVNTGIQADNIIDFSQGNPFGDDIF